MQLTITSRRFFIFGVIILLAYAVSLKVEKYTSTSISNIQNKSGSEKMERTSTRRAGKSKSKTKAKTKSKTSMFTHAPYESSNSIKLVREISQMILSDEKSSKTFQECLKYIVDKPDEYSVVLAGFWNAMSNVASKSNKWDNSHFQEIINALASKNIRLNSINTSCGSITLTSNPDPVKLENLLNQNHYFGGYNSVNNNSNQPYIDGMVSSHRDLIASNTFELINRASKGEKVVSNLKSNSHEYNTPQPSTQSVPSQPQQPFIEHKESQSPPSSYTNQITPPTNSNLPINSYASSSTPHTTSEKQKESHLFDENSHEKHEHEEKDDSRDSRSSNSYSSMANFHSSYPSSSPTSYSNFEESRSPQTSQLPKDNVARNEEKSESDHHDENPKSESHHHKHDHDSHSKSEPSTFSKIKNFFGKIEKIFK